MRAADTLSYINRFFIIFHDGFSCYFVFCASAELHLTFEVFSKLFDTLINMGDDAEEGKGQRNYDNKHMENLSSSTV